MAYLESIQKVTVTIAASSATGTATITSVPTGTSFLVWVGLNSDAADADSGPNLAYLELTNSTTITATRGNSAANALTVDCYVIESSVHLIDSIQTGVTTIALSNTSAGTTVTSVDLTRSVACYLGNTSSRASSTFFSSDKGVVSLTAATTVTAARGFGSGTQTVDVSWQVIEFKAEVVAALSQETINISGTNTVDTHTITSVDLDNTITFWGGQASTSGNWATSSTNAEITGATTITLTRTSTASATRYIRLATVQFIAGVLNSVQRGLADIVSTASTDDVTITAVTSAQTVVAQTGFSEGSGTTFSHILSITDLNTTTVVRSTRNGTTGAVGPGFEVWEFGIGPGLTSLAVTEEEDTLSAAAAVAITSSLASTEEEDTLSATSFVGITSSLASTEEEDTLSSTSFVGITSSLASTEEEDTLSSTSFVGITSSLASTEEEDTLSATVIHTANVSLASTEEDDTLSSTSFVGVTSSLASSEEEDTLSSTSFVGVTSSLASTEEEDTLSAFASTPGALAYFNMFNDIFNYMKL